VERVDVVFSERLWPSPWGWLLAPGLGTGVVISLVPVGLPVAVAVGAVVAAAVLAGLVAASPRIEVAGGQLRAGRARIPLTLLGGASWATGEEARQERGPSLDARAYLCIRGWVDPVVRVELDDPADPTPYWLVSTRRPAELVAALGLR
jgi:hypothetical protein